MVDQPRFSIAELWDHEDDARSAFLNEDGALSDPGHWLGLVIDESRFCRELIAEVDHLTAELKLEREVRLHGHAETFYAFPATWPSI